MRKATRKHVVALTFGYVVAMCLVPLAAQGQLAPKPAAKAKLAPSKGMQPPTPVTLPEPPLPVQQSQQLGLSQCSGIVEQMSRGALNSKYEVQSGWNREAPAQHLFQSVAILDRPEITPANGLAAIIAAPTAAGSCDGVTVQVFPLAGDCAAARTYMQSTGSSAVPILGARIMTDRNGKRVFLLPGVNKTCIAVSVDSTFGTAAGEPSPAPQAIIPAPVATPSPQADAILPTPNSLSILPTGQSVQ